MIKIHQTLLGDQVYAIIWEQIVSHKHHPGDKISDLHLSQELGVSLESILTGLQTQIGIFQVYDIHSSSLWLLSLDQHLRILDALKERDCRAAEQAMERHIQEVKSGCWPSLSAASCNSQRNEG